MFRDLNIKIYNPNDLKDVSQGIGSYFLFYCFVHFAYKDATVIQKYLLFE